MKLIEFIFTNNIFNQIIPEYVIVYRQNVTCFDTKLHYSINKGVKFEKSGILDLIFNICLHMKLTKL